MNNRIVAIATLIIFTMLSHNSQAATVLVFGDSLSAGYGVEQGKGWVDLLAKKLAGAHELVNASISGETTGGGLRRFSGAIKRHQPDLVILELGGNDGLRGYPTRQMRQNLQQMIDQAKDIKANVLLVGMHIPPNYGKRYTRAFYQVYTELAEQNGVLFLPFLLEGIATQPALMQSDGIHPNTQAQPLIMKNVIPYLPAGYVPAS